MCTRIKKIEKHLTLKKTDSYKESTEMLYYLMRTGGLELLLGLEVHIGMLMEELGLENLATTEEI